MGQTITFGMFNTEQKGTTEFLAGIDEELQKIVKEFGGGQNLSLQVQEAKKSLKVKLLTYIQDGSRENEFDAKVKTLQSSGNNDLKVSKASKNERDKYLAQMKQDRENHATEKNADQKKLQNYPINTLEQNGSKKAKPNISFDSQIRTLDYEPAGGYTMYRETCGSWGTNPFCGDGQDRLKQKDRFGLSGGVYDWLPYWVSGEVMEIDANNYTRQVTRLEMGLGWLSQSGD